MKKIFFILILLALVSLGGDIAQAQTPLTYTPLEPIPGFNDNLTDTNLPDLLKAIFRIIFSLAALLSVVMFVVGGVEYMVSDVVSLKSKAKERLQNTLWGMLILAGSWLILYTVNPDLLDFSFSLSSSGSYTAPTSSGGGGPSNATTPGTSGNGGTPNSSLEAYPANSQFARSFAQKYGLLQNTAGGIAVLSVNSSENVVTLDKYKEFYNQCAAVGNPVKVPGGNPGLTAYLCLKR